MKILASLFFNSSLAGQTSCPDPIGSSKLSVFTKENRCVYFYDDKKSFVDAEKECAQIFGEGGNYGKLVSIHHEGFQEWFYDEQKKQLGTWSSIWIGLRTVCDTCPLEWVDEQPMQNENWQNGEPNGIGFENCVEQHAFNEWPGDNDGLWNDIYCSSAINYACQIYPTGAPEPPVKNWPIQGGCPEGWLQFAGACYVIPIQGNGAAEGLQLKNFVGAEQDCQSRSPEGHLAMITNQFHKAFLASQFYRLNLWSTPYIGIHAEPQNGEFYYVDRDPLVYSNWKAKNPNMPEDDERCVIAAWNTKSSSSNALGEWTDSDCATIRPWVCTMPVQPNLPDLPLPNPNNCPSGMLPFADDCYAISAQELNFNEGRDYCDATFGSFFKNGKTDLASVIHPYENEFIQSILGGDLTDRQAPERVWLGLNIPSSGEMSWSDGHHFDYSNWWADEPVSHSQGASATMEPSGRWRSAPHTAKYRVICKGQFNWRDEESVHDYRGELMNCSTHWDQSWHQYKEYCIHATDHERTWTEAQNHCQTAYSIPANLASVHDAEMNEYIFKLISQKANDEAWIGLSKHYSKGYEWADSSAVNFLSWAAGEPSEVALGEADCTEMNKAGNWNNRDCNRKKLPSVCSHARKWSNCQIAEGEKEPCGYAGITESICMDSFKCCYDPNSQMKCFIPANSNSKNHAGEKSGMSTGGAAALTAFCFLTLPGLVWAVLKYSGIKNDDQGFSNPGLN